MTKKGKTKPPTAETSAVDHSFTNLGIREKLLAILTKQDLHTATPIQHQVIPEALGGKDIIGIAQTGTGKTFAFGIPMIQQIAIHKGQGLVLVPTRELAQQVEASLKQIGTPLGLRSALLIGGVPIHKQVKQLQQNPHIVIATPGRLEDVLTQGFYNLSKVSIITLDEADRMLDIGFLPQIKRVLKLAPAEKQTMLFSATMPEAISSLAIEFMKMPLRIEIAPQGTAAKNVEQELVIVKQADKLDLLESLLKDNPDSKTIVFSRTKYGAKRIARQLNVKKLKTTEIHSNRTPFQRKAAMEGFTKGTFRIMVATDIAARGIDVKDITLVINYDLPQNSEDYTHRIGRTGRAGGHGKAISFVMPSEKSAIRKIERLIGKSLPFVKHPSMPTDHEEEPKREEKREKRYDNKRGGGSHHRKKRDQHRQPREAEPATRNAGRRRRGRRAGSGPVISVKNRRPGKKLRISY